MIKSQEATLGDIYAAFDQRKECFGQGRDSLLGMLNSFERGRVYTLVDGDGNIGGVIGFVLIWNGVAACGAITTHHLDKFPLGYTRVVRDLIDLGMTYYKAHRAEMTVQEDFTAGHRWARALGFEWEGRLNKYGPDGKDHSMYGRVR